MKLHRPFAVAALATLALPSAAQDLLIPDRFNQRVMLFNGTTGAVLNANFIPDGAALGTYDFQQPREVLQLAPYLFVLDTAADTVFRFFWDGANATFDLALQPGIDEAFGITADSNGIIYIANNGAQNGAPGAALVRMTPSGMVLPPLPVAASKLDDVEFVNGELLVCDSVVESIYRIGLDGTSLGSITTGTVPLTAPRSVLASLATGELIVATGGASTGVHRFDSGLVGVVFSSWNFWSVGAAADLGNGSYLLTGPSGFGRLNPNTGGFAFVSVAGGAQPGLFSRFEAAATCSNVAVNYCTAGTTSSGCAASLSAAGIASATASGGFTLSVSGVEGQKLGLIFYGLSGPAAAPWGGSGSFLCVKSPTQRMTTQSSGGSAGSCDGTLVEDWRAFLAAQPGTLGNPLQGGMSVHAQAWFRDPPSPKTTHLSNALEFLVCP